MIINDAFDLKTVYLNKIDVTDIPKYVYNNFSVMLTVKNTYNIIGQ